MIAVSPTPADLAALSPWALELARTFVSLAGDIALLVDARGVITEVALGASVLLAATANDWVGRRWIDTVTSETRPKIDGLLADVAAGGIARQRQVNLPTGSSADIPVSFSAIRLGDHGPVLVLGRDLGALASLQRRFSEVQRETERGYWRSVQAASRHRLLFHAATDAVLAVDPHTMRVIEAHPAAAPVFGRPAAALAGSLLLPLFDGHSQAAVALVLRESLRGSLPAEIRARPIGSQRFAVVELPAWRSPGRVLLRVRATEGDPERYDAAFTHLLDSDADAVVVIDAEGQLLAANPAFVRGVHAAHEAQVQGRPLADWLLRGEPDVPALIAEVLQSGVVRDLNASLRTIDGRPVPVALSGVLLDDGGNAATIGLTLRRQRGPGADERAPAELHAGLDALAAGLGQRPLPELLLEARAVAERHLIRTALARCEGDMDLAAELLGIGAADLKRRTRRNMDKH